jgi:NAD(P)-dependent dehydrogenase (short-subunit alcohol dehydrogenase family)
MIMNNRFDNIKKEYLYDQKSFMMGGTRKGAEIPCIHSFRFNWIATASQLEDEKIAAQYTLLKRAGTPMETASLIAYLATPGASYITGQLMVVDGGNCLQEHKGP